MSGKSAKRQRKRGELEQQPGSRARSGRAASRRQDDGLAAQMGRVSMEFSGPLPMPGMLQQYDDVVPGSADRIIRMAESEQMQRHSLERSFVSYRFVSLTCGTLVALAIVIGGFYLIATGHSAEGVALVLAEVVSLVGIYLYQQFRGP